MWRRVVLAGGSITAAPFLLRQVHAEAAQTPSRVKASELSIYDSPPAPKLEFLEEEIGPYRQSVSTARQAVWSFMEPMEASIQKVGEKYDVAKAHSADLVTYVREDPGALPRAGIITVAGLGGIIAAYRGGLFRKGVYASIGMLTAAAVCYPNQSVAISSAAWSRATSQVKDLWSTSVSDSGSSEKQQEAKEPAKEATDVVLNAKKDGVKVVSEADKDHGMSIPEDKEMYSTREN